MTPLLNALLAESWEAAGGPALHTHPSGYSYTDGRDIVIDGLDAIFTIFAASIVKECIDVMRATAAEAEANNRYMGDDVPTIVHISAIEKHFK